MEMTRRAQSAVAPRFGPFIPAGHARLLHPEAHSAQCRASARRRTCERRLELSSDVARAKRRLTPAQIGINRGYAGFESESPDSKAAGPAGAHPNEGGAARVTYSMVRQ